MAKKVIVLHFEVESQAYQAFSKIRQLHMERKIKGDQMAVVTHTSDGAHMFKVDDFLDFTGGNNTSTGGLIGMLVGVLGGPLAMLLGWFAGGMIGATRDAKEISTAQSIFGQVIEKIGEGETGLILIADEDDNRPLNQLVIHELGGEITPLDFDAVEDEIKSAKVVEEDAKKKASESWKEHHQDSEK